VLLAVAAVLLFVVGAPLLVLPDRTLDWAPWTVGSPLTATVVGGVLWAIVLMAVVAIAGSDRWVDLRAAVITTLVAGPLLLAATLLDADVLSEEWMRWAWVVVLAVVPVLAGAALFTGATGAPADVRREDMPSPALSALVALEAGALLALAGVLLFDSTRAARLVPWPASGLDSGTIGALAGVLGVAAAAATFEGEPRRLRSLGVLDIAAAVAVFAALLRDTDHLDWGRPMTWVVAVFMGLLAATGVWTVLAGRATEPAGTGETEKKRGRSKGMRERQMKRKVLANVKNSVLGSIKR